MGRVIGAIVGVLVLEAIIGLFIVYSGSFNVSALNQDQGMRRWVLSTTMDHSVAHNAKGIDVPPGIDSSLAPLGAVHYRDMCEVCHGGPGLERSEIGKGLNPHAPDLTRAARGWSDAELYWIIKNGIKMSGMPAFGPTHTEKELWAITMFVRLMPGMTSERYRSMGKNLQASDEDEHMEHQTHEKRE